MGDTGLSSPHALSIHVIDLVTVFFSLGMSRTEIVVRILSTEVSVPLQKIRGGRMNEDDWQRTTGRSITLSGKPLFIDDSPNLTTMEIHAKARRLKQHSNLQLICIDYIQLMTSGKKVESRQLGVSEFSRQIKLLAKELKIPVIALSQLSRSTEQRKDGVPQFADLCESGFPEQDVGIVIMPYRPELCTQSPTDEECSQTIFHILKHHNSRLDKVDAFFQGHHFRFMNQPVATFNST